MAIGTFRIEVCVDRLIKRAEHIANEHEVVSKIIDKAFDEVGKVSNGFFEMQLQYATILRMLRAWYAREYTDISPRAVVGLVASAIYVVNPIDLVPDFIPVIGRLDDKVILGYFIRKFNNEIQKFMAWEDLQGV